MLWFTVPLGGLKSMVGKVWPKAGVSPGFATMLQAEAGSAKKFPSAGVVATVATGLIQVRVAVFECSVKPPLVKVACATSVPALAPRSTNAALPLASVVALATDGLAPVMVTLIG